MAESTVLEAEVSGLIGLAGLMLVFFPFFLDRVRDHRAASSAAWIGLSRLLVGIAGLLVVMPCAAATLGLLTLWGTIDAALPVAVLTVTALASVALYTVAIVVLENTIWWANEDRDA